MDHFLKYIGTNPATDWLPGIPASDHAVASKRAADELVSSGLYEHAEPPAAAPAADTAESTTDTPDEPEDGSQPLQAAPEDSSEGSG